MTIRLPEDLVRFVEGKVRSGRFASSDEAIAEGLRLLQRHEAAEDADTVEAIRQGLDDMREGRGRPAEVVFAELRRDLQIPPDR